MLLSWQTIQILDIVDHKQAFSVQFSDQHSNTGPFDNQTQIYHLNARLVQYSDGYFTVFACLMNDVHGTSVEWVSYKLSDDSFRRRLKASPTKDCRDQLLASLTENIFIET